MRQPLLVSEGAILALAYENMRRVLLTKDRMLGLQQLHSPSSLHLVGKWDISLNEIHLIHLYLFVWKCLSPRE